MPFAAGRFFPVKILFAVNGGTIVPPNDRAQVMDAITAAVQQYTSPFVTYGMVAFNDFAFNQVAGATFVKDKDLPAALVKYTGFNQPGPLSMLNALQMAEALVSGDMLTQCPGTLARTRYVVVLLTFGRDESDLTRCNLTPRTSACAGLCNPGSGRSCPPVACSTCLLGETTQRIVGLESRYKAGDVTVQPILVRTQSDPQISTQIAAVARGGGTREIETDLALLKGALGGLNLAALTRPMRLKALYAFNRFARARGGQLVLDSDGDGLADDDEAAICRRSSGTLCTCKDPPDTAIPGGCAPPADRCLDPLDADTDCDGLMDGLEVAVGTDPTVPTSVPGCAVCADTDADGLYDCEERLLGTEACMGDTDGDGLSDLVEFLSVTNPLEPELTRDTDRDGFSNLEEVMGHTDPSSSDLAFIGSRMSRVVWDDASPSADGRPCYAVRVSNVALAETKEVPAGVDVCRAPVGHGRGVNNIYLYMVSAPEDDFSSAGVARLTIEPVTFIAPHTRQPADPIIPLFDGSLRTKP